MKNVKTYIDASKAKVCEEFTNSEVYSDTKTILDNLIQSKSIIPIVEYNDDDQTITIDRIKGRSLTDIHVIIPQTFDEDMIIIEKILRDNGMSSGDEH